MNLMSYFIRKKYVCNCPACRPAKLTLDEWCSVIAIAFMLLIGTPLVVLIWVVALTVFFGS